MQINSKILDFPSGITLWILKNILFAGVLYSVYLLLKDKGTSISEIVNYFAQIPFSFTLIVVLVLVPVNWGFEAWKWQRLALKVERINFTEAFRGVLAGLALANFTPFMIGDYAGKIGMLKTRRRAAGIGAVLLGNGMQLYTSLLYGCFGYLYFIVVAHPEPYFLHIYIVAFLCLLLAAGLWIVFNFKKLKLLSSGNGLLKYFSQYLIILKEYTLSDIGAIFLIATGRYIVFSLQFFMVLQLFRVRLPTEVMLAGISLVFLTKSLGAALNLLGDLSVRAITSVYYFGYFGVKLSLVASATFTIWFINVLIPLIIGSLFVLMLRPSAKELEVSPK